MRAVQMHGHGGPEVLRLSDDVADPVCGPGTVRVRVAASSVNNTDIWTREGAYGTPQDPSAIAGWRGQPIDVPRIQGADVVGIVESVGPGGRSEWLGRRVLVDPATYASDDPAATPVGYLGSEADGGFAELIVVPEAAVHDVGDSPLNDRQLAALPTAYGTALGMLHRADAAAGESIVITGASGGVGVALIQLAKVLGLSPIMAVSTSDKADVLIGLGADVVLDRHDPDMVEELRRIADEGVDVVADVVGGEAFSHWPGLLARHGRIVVAGAVAGPMVTVDLRQVYLNQRQIIGSSMHTRPVFAHLVALANDGAISPPIAATFDLDHLLEAQHRMRADDTVGKVVISCS